MLVSRSVCLAFAKTILLRPTSLGRNHLVKTMIFVCVLFAITWAPANIYALLLNINFKLTLRENGYYTIVVIGYIYSCTNPFIYAMKFDPVRRVLLGLIKFHGIIEPVESVEMT